MVAAGAITIDPAASVSGSIEPNATVAVIDIPQKTDIPAGTQDVIVELDAVRPLLPPGYYKELMVKARGKLILGPGRYTFTKFYLEPDAVIELDIGMADMVEVDVAGDMEFSDRSKVLFKTSGYVPFVRFYANDANGLRIGCQVQINGTITAPHADIHLYSEAQCNGALYGRKITVEPGAVILSDMTNPENDDDGDGISNYLEVLLGTEIDDSLSYVPIAIPSRSWLNNDAQDECVTYDYSRYFPEYPADKKKEACFPRGSLCNPHLPLIFTVENDPQNSAVFTKPGFRRIGRFISMLPINCIAAGNVATVTFPRPPSHKPGIEIELVRDTGSGGDWEPVDPVVLPSPPPPEEGDEGGPVEPPGITFEIHPAPPGGSSRSFAPVQKEKITSTTLYFDNAIVFTEKQKLALGHDLTVFDWSEIIHELRMRVYYTPVGGGTQETVDIKFSSESFVANYGSVNVTVNVFTADGRIPFANPVVINSCELINVAGGGTETSLYSQSFGGNFVLGSGIGMAAMLKLETNTGSLATANPLIAWYPANAFEFESAGFGDGRIIAGSGGTPFEYEYYLKDHLGSTRMALNELGDPVEATMYQPYGTMVDIPTALTSALNVREKFTTKEFDEEGGTGVGDGLNLFYFGARVYDPELGVWGSRDPKGQYSNPYGYSSNPINTVDPNGEWANALYSIFKWYGEGVSSNNGEYNPAKWDWTSKNSNKLWFSTVSMAFSSIVDFSNDISGAIGVNNAAREVTRDLPPASTGNGALKVQVMDAHRKGELNKWEKYWYKRVYKRIERLVSRMGYKPVRTMEAKWHDIVGALGSDENGMVWVGGHADCRNPGIRTADLPILGRDDEVKQVGVLPYEVNVIGRNLRVVVFHSCCQGLFTDEWGAVFGPDVKFYGWMNETDVFEGFMFTGMGWRDNQPSSLRTILKDLP